MNLRVRLDRRVLLVATLPVFLLLAAVNLVAGWLSTQAHYTALSDMSGLVVQELNRRVAGEVLRMDLLGDLPNTRSLLKAATRGRGAIQSEPDVTSEAWRALARDDMRVREALDNTVADTLRNMTEASRSVKSLLLTDAAGRLLAASDKPDRYEFVGVDWWKRAHEQPEGHAVAEGVNADGTLGLSLPLYSGTATSRVLRGVIRAEISTRDLAANLLPESAARNTMVALLGDTVVPVWGTEEEFGKIPARFEAMAKKNSRKLGSLGRIRFTRHPLNSGLSWIQPASVVTLRNDAVLGLAVYIALTMLVVVSVVLAIYWDKTCRMFLNKIVINPQAELLEAGDWILRTALGRPSLLQPSVQGEDVDRQMRPEVTPLQKELQKWLHRLLQDLQDEYTSQTYEMQRDLSLARDFQQAYIDRAYPKVPAVHVEGRLRLDFYHRYQPALALGGDFYNILTLASDCAGVFISDVMGHGTRSALITAIMRTLIDDLEPQGRNARHFLTEINRLFCGLLTSVPSPLFASAFYFVADTTARVATFSSAGHPSPFHIRRSVARVSRLEVPMPRGAALGMIPNEKYTGGYCRLIDGDVFVFFTDGVYEAHNVHGEEFGIARMEEVFRKLMYKSAKEMVDGIMDAITTFVEYEPIADDICLVAVEVTTKAVV